MLSSGSAGIWHSYPATANDAPSPDGPSTCGAARHVRTGEGSGRTASGGHQELAGGDEALGTVERGQPLGDLSPHGDVRLAHGPDESVEVDEIVRPTEALVLATLRARGTKE
jgi:acetylornithine deacetylase/succinyl-diaminopimelate desuccinylase-like protein